VATETLKWDSFLTEGDRKHLDGFREIEWPNIRRVLYQAPYENIAPKGVEPHWVLPGKAVYWQEQIVREHVELKDDEGIPYRDVLEVSAGWQPTGPLPANNASVIAHYLRKGFRLRPPGREDVEVEEMVPTEEPAQTEQFKCYRHGNRKWFKNWKSYLQHCARYQEPPEHDVPDYVVERQRQYAYYCLLHDKGFQNSRSAKRHQTVELRRPGKSYHPSLEDMKVQNA